MTSLSYSQPVKATEETDEVGRLNRSSYFPMDNGPLLLTVET
jgi:hypothetical protein